MNEPRLILIDDDPPEWQLDDETRRIGREGLAKARAALREAAAVAIAREGQQAA
jgi:hypothetical protein